jgi:N-acetyl-anhydromuramyl-L-alanine amidase AmpD
MRLVGAADAIRAEGARVVEVAEVDNVIHEGDTWKRRGHEYAAGGPTCITWHHTAVDIPQVNIVRFELYKYESTPGNNVNIGRDGTVYLLAAGSTATNGAGTQLQFSRGMGGKNSTTFTMEIHNDGRGQPYPQAQIDACFAVSNAINRLVGNQPTDLCTHHEYAMDRKTDPATAGAVQGPWQPRACTSSGTWHHDDIRAEAVRRWSTPQGDEFDMATLQELEEIVDRNVNEAARWLVREPDGTPSELVKELEARFATLKADNAAQANGVLEKVTAAVAASTVENRKYIDEKLRNFKTDVIAAVAETIRAELAPKV